MVSTDGKLFIIGGLGQGQSEVQVFYPQENKWTKWKKNPFHKRDLGSVSTVVIHGTIRMCGGLDVERAHNYIGCAKLNPKTQKWSRMASMIVGVNHQAAGTDGKKMYIFGGRTLNENMPGNGIKTVQIYDPRTNRWTLGPEMLWGRSGHGNVPFINGLFYLTGGEEQYQTVSNNNKVFYQTHTFNPSTGVWSDDNPRLILGVHGIYPVADVYRGLIYVAGGGWKAGRSQSSYFQVLDLGTHDDNKRGRRHGSTAISSSTGVNGASVAVDNYAGLDQDHSTVGRIRRDRGTTMKRLICVAMTVGAPAQQLDCGVDYEISHFHFAKYGSLDHIHGRCGNYVETTTEGNVQMQSNNVDATSLLEPGCIGKASCWITADSFVSKEGVNDTRNILVVEAVCKLTAAAIKTEMLKIGNGRCRTSNNGGGTMTRKTKKSLDQCLQLCQDATSCVGVEFEVNGVCELHTEKLTHVKKNKKAKCFGKVELSPSAEALGLEVCTGQHTPL